MLETYVCMYISMHIINNEIIDKLKNAVKGESLEVLTSKIMTVKQNKMNKTDYI